MKAAYKWATFFKKIYKDFYVEIQRNGVKECEDAIPLMLKLAKDFELPVVATCDSHYLNKGDHNIQEINWCIRDAKLLTDNTRNKKWSEEFYVKSASEMKDLFEDIPEAIENTQKIADSVEFYSIKYDRVQPLFWNKLEGLSSREMLREIAYLGASRKFTTNLDHHGTVVCNEWIDIELTNYELLKSLNLFCDTDPKSVKIRKDILERLEFELQVIHDKGYDDYFLVVSDFLKWSKSNGIMCGVRGSVGGALTAFVTDITDIDPIRWELYFERFLNPERMSPPDIDCDFQDDRRHEVVEYIKMRYGESNCSLICALGRLKTRAAIRDVSRVMGIDLKIADKLSKLVVVKFGKPYSAADMMLKVEEFRNEVNKDPRLVEMIEIVKKIENMPRQAGTHACGLLITPKPVIEYAPLQLDKEKRMTCQLEMKPIEELGLMKFDLLGLTNLTIIKNAINFIERYHNVKIDPWKIPHNDQKTFELLQKGDTDGVFQLESEGMKKYLKELSPSTVDDICFMCAAYRPGPMQFIQPYIDCKHGKKEPEYLIPALIPILSSTYGYAIYQEQVIRIAVEIAGYTMGQADMLRRAMGKKVKEIMEGERAKFIQGCLLKDYNEEIGNKLFDYLMPFADYGFNKSHSAGYAMIAYQTAFLKAHYRIEFLAGLMQADLGVADKLKRDIQMAKDSRVEVLPPSINHSDLMFTIENKDAIRFGLGGIKSVSKKTMEMIVEEREKNGIFDSLDDLVYRMGVKNLSKSNLEILTKIGCFDCFGNRAQILAILPEVITHYTKPKVYEDQSELFSVLKIEDAIYKVKPTSLSILEDIDNKIKVSWENEFLGTFFSNHPLLPFASKIDNELLHDISNIQQKNEFDKVRLIAILKEVKKINTKKDGKPMAFLKIEDMTSEIEGVLFTLAYEKTLKKLGEFKVGEVFIFTAKVSNRDNKISILIDDIVLLEDISTISDLKPIVKYNQKNSTSNSQTQIKHPSQNVTENIILIPERIKIDITQISDPITLKRIKDILMTKNGNVKVTLKINSNGSIIEKDLNSPIEYNSDVHNILENYLYN